MRRQTGQSTAFAVLFVVIMLTVSCVDDDYRIDVDDIDTNIHVSPGGITIPLGTIDHKTLSELVSSHIEGLTVTGDGRYALRYDDAFEYEVDPINIPSVSSISTIFENISISVSVPSLDFSGKAGVERLYLTNSGNLPVSGNIGATTVRGRVKSDGGRIRTNIGLPEEIASVNRVLLGPAAAGTPMTFTLDIGALRNVNAGTLIESLVVDFPARYTLRDPSAGSVGPGADGGTANRLTVTGYNAGTSGTVAITFYIEGFTLGDMTPIAGSGAAPYEISFTESFGCELNYAVNTRPGYVDASLPPSVTIDGSPEFRDAVFTTREITVGGSGMKPLDYRLGFIPYTVEKLVSVDFGGGEDILVITVDDPGLPFKNSEPEVRITFPPVFVLDDPSAQGSVLTAPLSEFAAGYRLRIGSIDLGDDGIPGSDRYIDFGRLGYKITVDVAHTFLPETLTWSSDVRGLRPRSRINAAMNSSGMDVSTIHAELDFSLDHYISGEMRPIDLTDITGELGDGVLIPDLVSPTITLMVTNPAGISMQANLTFDPKGKDGASLGAVTVDDLLIRPSDEEGSETTWIFIAEEGIDTPADHHYTRYYANLSDLVETIPVTIDVGFSARATTNEVHTVPLGEGIPLELEYAFDIPLTFGEDMDMNINLTQGGMNKPFRDIARSKVMAEDIEIGAELTVSFPLKVESVAAEFTDADGNGIPGLVTTVTGAVEGPKPGAGGAKTSTFTIAVTVPDGGDFQALSEIHTLRWTLPVTGTGKENSLHPDDYITGKAWATLLNGATLDIKEL